MIKNIFIEIDCQLIEIWYLQNISVLSVNIRLHKSAISRHIKSLFMNMKSSNVHIVNTKPQSRVIFRDTSNVKSVHEGEKFKCTHCEYKVIQKGDLQRHMKSLHEGQKFQCPQCEYKAAYKGYLQTHVKSVHEGRKFQCPHCEHKATRKEHLKAHMKTVHEGQKFQCPHCEYKATYIKDTFRRDT